MEKTIEKNDQYNWWVVYQWSVYPNSSVLAGQDCKQLVDSYDTLTEAQAAHPSAEVGYRDACNTYDHLSNSGDEW